MPSDRWHDRAPQSLNKCLSARKQFHPLSLNASCSSFVNGLNEQFAKATFRLKIHSIFQACLPELWSTRGSCSPSSLQDFTVPWTIPCSRVHLPWCTKDSAPIHFQLG